MSAAPKRHQLEQHHGGWVPQRPDQRDREHIPRFGKVDVAHNSQFALDIRGIPRINQKQQGSCTGHGTAGIVMLDQKIQKQKVVIPSRAMIYYGARKIEGTTDQDSGAQVRDAVKAVANWGVAPDSEFPYDDQVFDRAPSAQVYKDAVKQEALVYEAPAYPHLNATLLGGLAIVFGFTVYESFESEEVARTGIVPIPGPGEKVLGGHCPWAWGYNADYRSSFKAPHGVTVPPRTKGCRNSWMDEGGPRWGDNGDFYLPQWYWDTGNATDPWVIRRVGRGK